MEGRGNSKSSLATQTVKNSLDGRSCKEINFFKKNKQLNFPIIQMNCNEKTYSQGCLAGYDKERWADLWRIRPGKRDVGLKDREKT